WGDVRGPGPRAWRRLGARGVGLAQQREPAVEPCEVGPRMGRVRRDDALDHLAAAREIAGLERQLGREQQRVRRARIARRRAGGLLQLATRIVLTSLLEVRPRQRR